MEKAVRSLSLHPTVKKLVAEAKQDIAELTSRSWDTTKEVEEKKERIKLLRQMWRKHGSTPLVQQMVVVVEEKVNHYHADFFLHDLVYINKFSGRFMWAVGDCGTHLHWLDNETEEEEKGSKDWVNAVSKNYGHYALYEGDTNKGTLKKTTYDRLEFRIVTPKEVKVPVEA